MSAIVMHKSSLNVVAPRNTCPPKVPFFCCAHITARLIKKVSDEKNWKSSQKPGTSQMLLPKLSASAGSSAITMVDMPKAIKKRFNL
jgi:hypothetical protein